jgi:hypothetical protein
MKNILMAAIAAACLGAGPLAALSLEPHAGYTTVSMGDLNRANDAVYGYWGVGPSVRMTNAVVAGLDLMQAVDGVPGLSLGLRGDWLQTNLAQTTNVDPYTPSNDFSMTDQGNLSSLLLGGKLSAPFLLNGLDLGLGAWLGYGYATLSQRVSKATLEDGLFMGSLWVGQLEGSLRYSVAKHISLAFTGGWRWANAGSLYDDQHHALYDSIQYWHGGNRRALSDADFSGISAQGSVGYSF